LARKPEEWKLHQSATRGLENNTGIDLKAIWWEGVDWINQAQNKDKWRATVNTVTKLWVPYAVGRFLSTPGPSSFSRTLIHAVN
jgi:hypothetical protein